MLIFSVLYDEKHRFLNRKRCFIPKIFKPKYMIYEIAIKKLHTSIFAPDIFSFQPVFH